MTVVQSYICEVLSKSTPQFSSIPSNVGNLIVQAISLNSAYTSRIMVSIAAAATTHTSYSYTRIYRLNVPTRISLR